MEQKLFLFIFHSFQTGSCARLASCRMGVMGSSAVKRLGREAEHSSLSSV
jgi:hypothetical protein